MSLVVGHFPVEIFLRVIFLFDATHTSKRMFFRKTGKLSLINGCFFFPISIKH